MKRITINLESTSALKLSEYRKFAKSWKPDTTLMVIFKRISKGKSKYRVYVSPTKGIINLTTRIPTYVEKHIRAKGYSVDQLGYIRGYATDKHGRQVKIGKILSDNDAYLDMFVKHEGRKRDLQILEREQYVLAVSHHAYDIVGASTDRGWTSCTDLRGGYAPSAPTRIQPEVDNRSIIAYLVRKEDTNIQKPMARALAKRFVSDAGSERYMLDAIYPNQNALLLKTFQAWLDRNINKYLPAVPHDYTLFSLPKNQYKDGHSNTDGDEGISKKATGQNLENLFKRLPTGLPSTQNLMAFMLKFYSKPSVINTIQKDDAYRTKLFAKIMRMRMILARNDNEEKRLPKLKAMDIFIANLLEGMYGGRYPLGMAMFLTKAGKHVESIERVDEEYDLIDRYLKDDDEQRMDDSARPVAYPTGTAALSYIQNGLETFYADRPKGSSVLHYQEESPVEILRSLYKDLDNKGEVIASCFGRSISDLHRDLLFVSMHDWFDYVPWQQVYRHIDRSSTLFTTLTLRGNINTDRYFENKSIPLNILMPISLLRMVNVYDMPPDIPEFCKVIERIEILLAEGIINKFNVNYLYRVKSVVARDRNIKRQDVELLNSTLDKCPNILREFTLDEDDY